MKTLFQYGTNLGGRSENISFTFNPTINTYSLNVENDLSETTVTATVNHPGASINGEMSISNKIPLGVGDTVIKIVVTAENETTNTYTITITRAGPEGIHLRIKVFLEGPLQ